MTGDVCPGCDGELSPIWAVTVTNALPDYTPVFPDGHTRTVARCDACGTEYQRIGDGRWSRQAPADA